MFLTWWTVGVSPQCCDASCTSWLVLNRCLWLPLETQKSQVQMVKQTQGHWDTQRDAVSRRAFSSQGSFFVTQNSNKAEINIYSTANKVLWAVKAEIKTGILQTDGHLPTFCIHLYAASIYTGPRFASFRYSTYSCCVHIKPCLVTERLCESQPLRDPVLRAANLQL